LVPTGVFKGTSWADARTRFTFADRLHFASGMLKTDIQLCVPARGRSNLVEFGCGLTSLPTRQHYPIFYFESVRRQIIRHSCRFKTGECLVSSGWLVLCGDLAVMQAPLFDGFVFDPFSLFD
jgi:hypothetical protein